jgi:branched-chain amino acid transport system permease protein
MSAAMLAQVLANGLLLGGLYAAIAAGFSLVWGVLNIVNMVHGSAVVLGSYAAFFGWQRLGLNPFVAAVVVGPAIGVLGYLIQRFLVGRVIAAPVLITLVMTFAIDLVLNNAMLVAFTADYRKIAGASGLRPFRIGTVSLPADRLIATVLAVVAAYALHLYLHTSRLGRAIVAVRMDSETAKLMGVRVERIYNITFAIGLAMAGMAGCFLAAVYPVSPLASGGYLGVAFTACVLGGLGSVAGAIVGGLALGIVESFGALALGTEYSLTVAAVLLIAMLLWRPQGLLGRAGYE